MTTAVKSLLHKGSINTVITQTPETGRSKQIIMFLCACPTITNHCVVGHYRNSIHWNLYSLHVDSVYDSWVTCSDEDFRQEVSR